MTDVTPTVFNVWQKVPATAWILGENDKIGDCTCVAVANAILFHSTLAGKPVHMTDALIVELYKRFGYNPAIPSTDQGAIEETVLKSWLTKAVDTGSGGDTLKAFFPINPQKMANVRRACYLATGLYIGVQLPLSAEGASEWTVSDASLSGAAAPGSWGGHAVFLPGFDADGFTVITWGAPMPVTDEFMFSYVDEVYALVDPDEFATTGLNSQGFTLDQVMTELKALSTDAA